MNISGISFCDTLSKLAVGCFAILPIINNEFNVLLIFVLLVCLFIVGTIIDSIIKHLTRFLRNNKYLINKANQKNKEEHKKQDKDSQDEHEISLEEYYKAYYIVAANGILMNVPKLEALESFLRNIFFVLLFYLVGLLANCPRVLALTNIFSISHSHLAIGLFAVIFIIPFIWVEVQIKIHKLILEGKYYLDKLEEEKSQSAKSDKTDNSNLPQTTNS